MNMTLRSTILHLCNALGAFGLAFMVPVTAAPLSTTAASPQCSAAEYHQLDFWLGDLDTFETGVADGPPVAHARVESIAQGCAIHELYEQTDGLVGESITSYDAVRKQWQQTWVTNRGALLVMWGAFNDGALVLEGEAHLRDGTALMQRITWRVHGNGVRESALSSKDGGKTWHSGDIAVPNTEAAPSPNETEAVQLADGRVQLNVRAASEKNRRVVVESKNGFSGWSAPRYQEDLPDPICFGSIIRLSTAKSGGRNRLVFANPASTARADGKPMMSKDRRNLTLRVSYDEGKTWTESRERELSPATAFSRRNASRSSCPGRAVRNVWPAVGNVHDF